MKYNSVALNTLAKVVMGTNHNRQWNTDLTWYLPKATCLLGFEHILRIHGSAAQEKFLQPSGFCIVINYAFSFHTKNASGCDCGFIA